jgi:hypothetical protein
MRVCTAALFICCTMVAGCGSPRWLENRVACTVDGAEAHVISKWGPLGVGAKIAPDDARVLCKRPV